MSTTDAAAPPRSPALWLRIGLVWLVAEVVILVLAVVLTTKLRRVVPRVFAVAVARLTTMRTLMHIPS